jgi:hypothetical protein
VIEREEEKEKRKSIINYFKFLQGFGDEPVTSKTRGLFGRIKFGNSGLFFNHSARCSSQSEILGPRLYGLFGSGFSSGSSSTSIFEISKVA